MKYTLHLTMTPFVGHQLNSQEANQLITSLVEFTKDVEVGYVNAANRQATLVIDTEEPQDLIKKVVPWCIVTGEHPHVEPVVSWDDFVQSLADISGVDLQQIKGNSGVPDETPDGAPEGCCSSAKSISELKPFKMPVGGEDLLEFIAWDTIEVPGVGEEDIELKGTYQIERQHPTSSDWNEAEIDIKMKKLDVKGVSEKFGRIEVSTNNDYQQSQGKVQKGTAYTEIPTGGAKLCEMNNFAKFKLPDLGLTLFNKEPIELKHTITHVPPVGQGGGTGDVRIPLFNVDDPNGEPIAYLKRVKTHIGDFCKGHSDERKDAGNQHNHQH